MKTIIVCDAIHQDGFDLLAKEKDIKVINATEVPKNELLNMLGDVDVAITRSPTDVDEAFLNAGKNLKAVVRAGVGVDNCDIDACSKRGIILMNVWHSIKFGTFSSFSLLGSVLTCSSPSLRSLLVQ